MNVPTWIRPGSAVRGAGVALACLSPRWSRRAQLVSSSYVAGWPLSRPGVRFVEVVPDEDAAAWRRAVVPFATSQASWSTVMLAAIFAARRSSLPVPIAAVLLGGTVVVGDSLLVELVERARARAPDAPADKGEGEGEGPEFPA